MVKRFKMMETTILILFPVSREMIENQSVRIRLACPMFRPEIQRTAKLGFFLPLAKKTIG
jgi:hypothetical protein